MIHTPFLWYSQHWQLLQWWKQMLNKDEQLKHTNNICAVFFKDAKLKPTICFSSQPEISIHWTCPKFSKNLAKFRKFQRRHLWRNNFLMKLHKEIGVLENVWEKTIEYMYFVKNSNFIRTGAWAKACGYSKCTLFQKCSENWLENTHGGI